MQILELTDGRPALSTGTMIVDDTALGSDHGDGSGFHCAREDVDLSNTEGDAASVYTARGMVPGEPTNQAPFRGACVCEERHGKVYCGASRQPPRTMTRG